MSDSSLRLGRQLAQYGVTAVRDQGGTWHVGSEKGPLLFDVYDKYKYAKYHTGGVVGGGDVKSNEQLALLKNDEWVLSEKMVKNLTAQIDRLNQLSKMAVDMPAYHGQDMLAAMEKLSGKTVNNVTNNSRPVNIQIGDTVIHGADQNTVQEHVKVSRDMVNQIARMLGIRR